MNNEETTLLKNSRLHISKAGKWMSFFSIFAFIGILFLVCGGLALLYYSGTLPEDMPHYIDNLVGLGGIALIILAATLLYPIVLLRQLVNTTRAIKYDNSLNPVRHFFHVNRNLWHYMAILMLVVIVLAIFAAIMLGIFFLPTLSTI